MLDPENIGVALEIAFLSSLQKEMSTSGLAAAMLDFWLPVASDIILHSSVQKADPKNIGIAVGLLALPHLGAEILTWVILTHGYQLRTKFWWIPVAG